MTEIPAWLFLPLGALLAALAVMAWLAILIYGKKWARLYYEYREEAAEARSISAEREREADDRTLILRKAQIASQQELAKLEAHKNAAARDTKDIARGLDLDLDHALAEVKAITQQRDQFAAACKDLEKKFTLIDKSLRETMAREDESQQMLERSQKENKELKVKLVAFDRSKIDQERLSAAHHIGLRKRE